MNTQANPTAPFKYPSLLTQVCDIHHAYNPNLFMDMFYYMRNEVNKIHLLNNTTNKQKFYMYNDIFSNQVASHTGEFESTNLGKFDYDKSMKQRHIFWKSIKNEAKNNYKEKLDKHIYQYNNTPSFSQTRPTTLSNRYNRIFDGGKYSNVIKFYSDTFPITHDRWGEEIKGLEYITDYYILYECMNLYHELLTNTMEQLSISGHSIQNKIDKLVDSSNLHTIYENLDNFLKTNNRWALNTYIRHTTEKYRDIKSKYIENTRHRFG